MASIQKKDWISLYGPVLGNPDLLSIILKYRIFSSPNKLLAYAQVQLVCKLWHDVIHTKENEELWKELYTAEWHPLTQRQVGLRTWTWKKCFMKHLELEKEVLPKIWTPQFRESLEYGKYTRWATDLPTKVVYNYVISLHLLRHVPPVELDENDEGTVELDDLQYHALKSMEIRTDEEFKKFRDQIPKSGRFDVEEFIQLCEYIFTPDRVEALLWEIHSVLCRGVKNFKPGATERYSNSRQLTAMRNLIGLARREPIAIMRAGASFAI